MGDGNPYFSQYDEEKAILEFFGDKADGVLYDFGAGPGRNGSNWFRLIERGWTGVLVEAAPACVTRLMDCCKKWNVTERVNVVQALIAGRERIEQADGAPVKFMEASGMGDCDLVSSADPEHVARWSKTSPARFRPLYMWPVNVRAVLRAARALRGEAHFISIDVEGLAEEVLAGVVKRWALGELPALRLVCVEHEACEKRMLAAVERAGGAKWATFHRTPENLLLEVK